MLVATIVILGGTGNFAGSLVASVVLSLIAIAGGGARAAALTTSTRPMSIEV